MKQVLTGTFRLLRQVNGVGAYAAANVEVQIEPHRKWPAGASLQLVTGTPRLLSEEREAALSGANDALEILAPYDARLAHAEIVLTHLDINDADTEPSAVRAATAAAVADAIGLGQNVSLSFDDGWRLSVSTQPGE